VTIRLGVPAVELPETVGGTGSIADRQRLSAGLVLLRGHRLADGLLTGIDFGLS
jgi:hypothetical protein